MASQMTVRVHLGMEHPDDADQAGLYGIEDDVVIDGERTIALPDLITGAAEPGMVLQARYAGIKIVQVFVGLPCTPYLAGVEPDTDQVFSGERALDDPRHPGWLAYARPA